MNLTSKFYLAIMVLLGLQSCKKNDAIVEPKVEQQAKSWVDTVEVNKIAIQVKGLNNPDWDWNNPNQNYISVNYLNFLGGTVSREITLPWKTQGNPLNAPIPDIKTEDGWGVVLMDFGTKEQPVNFPFLAIYNQKTSLLRCFVYNSQRLSANNFVGKLIYFGVNSDHSLLISKTKPAVTEADTYGSWINLEFELPFNVLKQLIKNNELRIDVRCLVFNYYNTP